MTQTKRDTVYQATWNALRKGNMLPRRNATEFARTTNIVGPIPSTARYVREAVTAFERYKVSPTDVEDARRWRTFRQDIFGTIRDAFGDPPVDPPPAPPTGPRAAFISPADLHIGKLGVEGYDSAVARQVVYEATHRLLIGARAHGCDHCYLILGNDWMHIDTPQSTTTAGTPQDSEPYRKVIRQGVTIARGTIDLCRAQMPTTVRVVPSNHDRAGSYWLAEVLAAYYGYRLDTNPRQYIQFGECLVGLEHGDGAKHRDLPLIMAKERPAMWAATRHRYWLTAHLHHLSEHDYGVTVLQAPSLSGIDRWHDKKGYVLSDKAAICYVMDAQHGNVARLLSYR